MLPVLDATKTGQGLNKRLSAILPGVLGNAAEDPTQTPSWERGSCAKRLPVKFMKDEACEGASVLQQCLKRPNCSDAVELLRETLAKAMATLQGGTCEEQSMQEHVAAVYSALENALRLGAREGFSKHCADMLRVTSSYDPEVELMMESMYVKAHSGFIEFITIYMQAIFKAITGASQR